MSVVACFSDSSAAARNSEFAVFTMSEPISAMNANIEIAGSTVTDTPNPNNVDFIEALIFQSVIPSAGRIRAALLKSECPRAP